MIVSKGTQLRHRPENVCQQDASSVFSRFRLLATKNGGCGIGAEGGEGEEKVETFMSEGNYIPHLFKKPISFLVD